MWMNYFSQSLNVHDVSDVKQTEIHTAEPLVPGSSRHEAEIAIARLKKYKSLGSNKILAELFSTGKSTNSLIFFGIRKNCLIIGKSLLFYQFMKGVTKPAVIIIMGYHAIILIQIVIDYPLKVKTVHS
jgi:hypothetical protein